MNKQIKESELVSPLITFLFFTYLYGIYLFVDIIFLRIKSKLDNKTFLHIILKVIIFIQHKHNRAHKIQIQSAQFSIVDGQLYKRSLGGPYLKCLTLEQAWYVLAELHESICGNHLRGRTLAHRAHTQGYYWPTMKTDAADYVRKCDPCQRMSHILKSLVQDLISISSPWPFAQWGIDIVGPLPIAPAQKKLLLVATDYFSKWIEAEAYTSIKYRDVTRFIWKNIVCRFGIPKSFVSDNGPQFDS